MDVAPAVKRKFEEDSDDIEREYKQFSDEFSEDNSDDVKIEKPQSPPLLVFLKKDQLRLQKLPQAIPLEERTMPM
jgi:hypothetical protein